MTSLPTTLTVEALKEVRDIIDSWIAELSPMEEPKERGAIITANGVAYIKFDSYWHIVSLGHCKTWQEILEYDPHPQIIYTPEGSE